MYRVGKAAGRGMEGTLMRASCGCIEGAVEVVGEGDLGCELEGFVLSCHPDDITWS